MNKRICALLLAIAVMTNLLSVIAFADGNPPENDTLTYNLGKQEVTVGWPALGESGSAFTFEADGSYTIQLEDDAFFPYQVQFQYAGKTTVQTFDTPDSTVFIGGHRIGVASQLADPHAISQIGVYIDGEYIPAKPAPKTFTSSSVSPMSLLPLARVYLTLDLTDKTPDQLRSVEVSAIIDGINAVPGKELPSGAAVLWDYLFEDNGRRITDSYAPIGSGPVSLRNGGTISMIVGTPNQLDIGNKRYFIDLKVNSTPGFSFQMYTQDEQGGREDILETTSTSIEDDDVRKRRLFIQKDYPVDEEYYLNISTYTGSYTTAVYAGHYDSVAQAQSSGKDITSQILNRSMHRPDEGYKANYSEPVPFTIVVTLGTETVSLTKYTVTAMHRETAEPEDYLSFRGIYHQQDDGARTNIYNYSLYDYDSLTNVELRTMTLDRGYPAQNPYYGGFTYYSGDKVDNAKVTKAVLGHYDTLQAASGQPDIKDRLLVDNMYDANAGYFAVYEDGVRFTLFVGAQVYKYTITVTENPGSSSTYFNVTGAQGIDGKNIYKVVDSHDSGAQQFGYQVLLVNDAAADLSSLKPTFTTGTGIEIYSSGRPQKSGENAQDFSGGPVMYTARAENGEDVKNYWVSFVKAGSGAELHVVEGESSDERKVFLDAYTNYRHDIFIANVGDAPLTGLNVQLQNPVNVKLDDYWKIGGAGNDTLAAIPDGVNSISNPRDGELPNIAKIRLVPDGDGEVSGTLVISSANGGSKTITLTGHAGDPQIITTSLDDAVKYVPYAFLIQTNNQYSWNKVAFSADEEDLPPGMILRPSGELYGVPSEAGVYTFTVWANHSYSAFPTSHATFTMTVHNNTKYNVEASVDAGYEVIDRVGFGSNDMIYTFEDTLFRSRGDINEFIDFWIDGEKQKPGVDYDAVDGSTAITIRAQTFQKYGSGTHTIAAEFRVGRSTDNDLKRSAQNYTFGTGTVTDGGGSSGGSSGRGGGSGNSGTSAADTERTAAANSNTATASSGSAATTTVSDAGAAQPRLIFRFIRQDYFSLNQLRQYANTAVAQGKTPWLNVDSVSMDGRAVDVRVGINPALASKGMHLAGSTYSRNASRTRRIFEKFFVNDLAAVIELTQEGEFEQSATVCVKLRDGVAVEDLVFYSYDPQANRYRKIAEPNAWVDSNSFLHFDTPYADHLVITIGALEAK